MCGFAGYISCNKQFVADQEVLKKMHTTIAHRGPDAESIWVSEKHQAAFVYRRLSIIDLSDAGSQPMFDAQKTTVIMFNGEIYNYKKLRVELEGYGHCFTSQTDTEVFLYAFKQWGIACLERLEGMFAAILGDLIADEWYCVRDRIGIKPFYFSLEGGYFSFASEIKALWNLPWLSQKLNHQALYHYLTFLVTPAPYTLYEGMYKLPAGMYIKVDAARKVTFHEWYNPLVPAVLYSEKDVVDERFCVENIRRLLTEAVKKRMIADVPFGVFLSGGIDSSLITALMSQFTDRVKTFNVSFSDGPEYSEVAWARKVSKLFNTEHYEITISEKEAFEFFEKMVYHQDEPLADSVCIPLYYVSKLLRDSGVTVVQVGEGSDELYCGYQSYAQYLDVHRRYYQTTVGIPQPLKKAGAWIAAQLFPYKKNQQFVLDRWATKQHLFWGEAIAFSDTWKQQLLFSHKEQQDDAVIRKIYPGLLQTSDSYTIIKYHLKKFYEKKPDADFLQSMIYLELKQRLPELLLMRVDKMTMATSVEGRVPFLDHAHVEFALQVASELKYKDGITKYILKKACEGILPNDVIYRKKVGFGTPAARWFKKGSYFKSYFSDLLVSQKKEVSFLFKAQEIEKIVKENALSECNYSPQLWALQNLLAQGVFK
jgi:asparagine synthase (glutamine-hydrolysing)